MTACIIVDVSCPDTSVARDCFQWVVVGAVELPESATLEDSTSAAEAFLRRRRTISEAGDVASFDYDHDEPNVLFLLASDDAKVRPLHALISAISDDVSDLPSQQHGPWQLALQAALACAAKSRRHAAFAKMSITRGDIV